MALTVAILRESEQATDPEQQFLGGSIGYQDAGHYETPEKQKVHQDSSVIVLSLWQQGEACLRPGY